MQLRRNLATATVKVLRGHRIKLIHAVLIYDFCAYLSMEEPSFFIIVSPNHCQRNKIRAYFYQNQAFHF